jgi:anaerobic magnesium-protoporphyrin IX monomethyl ester cyclase
MSLISSWCHALKIDTFLQTVNLLGSIRDRSIPTLVGGVFPTSAPELAISYEGIDLIGLQEGESTILGVAERVRTGRSYEDVPGTWFKRNDGTVIRNPNPSLVDLNGLIPDFSLFDASRFVRPMGGKFFRTIPIETYRGCPYQCTFCNSPMQSEFPERTSVRRFCVRRPWTRSETRSLS